jgi:hypothetical protein
MQMEDPFVLRQALDVTRRQLWDLQNRMTGSGSEAKLSFLSLDPGCSSYYWGKA